MRARDSRGNYPVRELGRGRLLHRNRVSCSFSYCLVSRSSCGSMDDDAIGSGIVNPLGQEAILCATSRKRDAEAQSIRTIFLGSVGRVGRRTTRTMCVLCKDADGGCLYWTKVARTCRAKQKTRSTGSSFKAIPASCKRLNESKRLTYGAKLSSCCE